MKMNNSQRFLNETQCVTLPRQKKCDYLKRDNYLSEYYTDLDKLEVLENLGILNYIQNILNTVNKGLNLLVRLDYLEKNFVKKKDVYYLFNNGYSDPSINPTNNPELTDPEVTPSNPDPIIIDPVINPSDNPLVNSSDNSDDSDDPIDYFLVVDDYLSLVSTNPVLNKIISKALSSKANVSDLELYVKLFDFSTLLLSFQPKLTAGLGINIDERTNVISTTLDLNPFVVVESLPEGDDINPNKIYLKREGVYYVQYKYTPEGWITLGRDYLEINIDLSKYYTKTQSDARYVLKGDYTEIQSITLSYVKGLLKDYVKKSEVYTNYYNGETDDPNDTGGDEDDNPGGGSVSPGGGNSFIMIDTVLNSTSENPVLNKVIYRELLKKVNSTELNEYVTRNYLTDVLSLHNVNPVLKTINNQSIIGVGNILIGLNVDDELDSESLNPLLNRIVYRELLKKANSTELNLYVPRTSLNELLTLKTINNLSIIGTGNIQLNLNVDSELSSVSLNPVLNKIINNALNNKVENSEFLTAINSKQNKLSPGYGISLNGNIISVDIDVNPFVITDDLPLIGETSKIYLKKNGSVYDLYIYTLSDGWTIKGSIDFNIDLTDYIKSSEVYQNFVTNENLITELNGYLKNDALENYITSELSEYNINSKVNLLREYVDQQFVKKEDVYTGGTETINPGGGGDIIPIDPSTINVYNSIIPDGTLTTVQVGNIRQGTDVATLKGSTFSLILDMMLFKEIWPVGNYEHNINLGILPTVVKVGDPIVYPTVSAVWNQNILPLNEITYDLVPSIPGNNNEIYSLYGIATFTLNYSYPAGTYVITSNYGNTREIEKEAKQGTISRSVKITYPWYLNDIEQSVLVPINTNYTAEISLTGTPSIAIPGENSFCQIQANLGLGFMDVTNWTKTTIEKNGITYSVWTKPDAYLQNVEHKFTFNISL